ncbi:MAG TPA: hypothetical protein QF468_13660 [Nitrospinota bacterium]|nr:hypothetical protein [Nitrospinota bacterium]
MPKRPLDITIFGILFLIGGPAELYNIIKTGWAYEPKFFGILTTGIAAQVVLMAQPMMHIAIGYGFLTLRKWSFYLALFYAADVLTSSISSFIIHGYGLIRTIFISLLTPYVIYLITRRKCFVR